MNKFFQHFSLQYILICTIFLSPTIQCSTIPNTEEKNEKPEYFNISYKDAININRPDFYEKNVNRKHLKKFEQLYDKWVIK